MAACTEGSVTAWTRGSRRATRDARVGARGGVKGARRANAPAHGARAGAVPTPNDDDSRRRDAHEEDIGDLRDAATPRAGRAGPGPAAEMTAAGANANMVCGRKSVDSPRRNPRAGRAHGRKCRLAARLTARDPELENQRFLRSRAKKDFLSNPLSTASREATVARRSRFSLFIPPRIAKPMRALPGFRNRRRMVVICSPNRCRRIRARDFTIRTHRWSVIQRKISTTLSNRAASPGRARIRTIRTRRAGRARLIRSRRMLTRSRDVSARRSGMQSRARAGVGTSESVASPLIARAPRR